MDKNRNGMINFFKGLLIGMIVAAGVALFTAPQSGMETRRMLRDRGVQLQDNMHQGLDKAREQMDTIISKTREQADVLAERVEHIGERIGIQSHSD